MSNNCIQFKLSGSVNIPGLQVLGIRKDVLDFTSDQSPIHHAYKFSKAVDISVDGNAYFTNSSGTDNNGQTMSIPANTSTDFYVKTTSAEIVNILIPIYFLINYSDESKVGSTPDSRIHTDVAILPMATAMDTIFARVYYGSKRFSDIPKSCKQIQISNGDILEASTTDISLYTNIEYLYGGGVKVSGDIAELGTLVKVKTIRLNSPDAANIPTGEVNTFIRNMIANGRASGTISMRFLTNGNITLNGSALANTNVSASISSATQYSVTCNSVTTTFVKSGDTWVQQ